MRLEFEGRTWEVDFESIDLKQGIAIHYAYGFTLNDLMNALEQADARALQCLYWLMLQQNGVIKPIQDCNCKIVDLADAFHVASEAQEAAEKEKAAAAARDAEPDPTPPSASPPPSPPPTETAEADLLAPPHPWEARATGHRTGS